MIDLNAIKREEMEDKDLATRNPWSLPEIQRLECFEAKMKYGWFQERDIREFQRLMKKHKATRLSENKVFDYAQELYASMGWRS